MGELVSPVVKVREFPKKGKKAENTAGSGSGSSGFVEKFSEIAGRVFGFAGRRGGGSAKGSSLLSSDRTQRSFDRIQRPSDMAQRLSDRAQRSSDASVGKSGENSRSSSREKVHGSDARLPCHGSGPPSRSPSETSARRWSLSSGQSHGVRNNLGDLSSAPVAGGGNTARRRHSPSGDGSEVSSQNKGSCWQSIRSKAMIRVGDGRSSNRKQNHHYSLGGGESSEAISLEALLSSAEFYPSGGVMATGPELDSTLSPHYRSRRRGTSSRVSTRATQAGKGGGRRAGSERHRKAPAEEADVAFCTAKVGRNRCTSRTRGPQRSNTVADRLGAGVASTDWDLHGVGRETGQNSPLATGRVQGGGAFLSSRTSYSATADSEAEAKAEAEAEPKAEARPLTRTVVSRSTSMGCDEPDALSGGDSSRDAEGGKLPVKRRLLSAPGGVTSLPLKANPGRRIASAAKKNISLNALLRDMEVFPEEKGDAGGCPPGDGSTAISRGVGTVVDTVENQESGPHGGIVGEHSDGSSSRQEDT